MFVIFVAPIVAWLTTSHAQHQTQHHCSPTYPNLTQTLQYLKHPMHHVLSMLCSGTHGPVRLPQAKTFDFHFDLDLKSRTNGPVGVA